MTKPIVLAAVFAAIVYCVKADDDSWDQTQSPGILGEALGQRKRPDPRCRGRYGLFPIPEDCTSYLVCRRGKATVMKCPDDYRFDSVRYCTSEEADCGRTPPSLSETEPTFHGDVCSLPPDSGPCRAIMTMYFYDTMTGQCEEFIYGGCRGNANRFRTLEDCLEVCGSGDASGVEVTCPEPYGNFSIPGDCRRYFSCSESMITFKRCPEGWAFDRVRRECVPADEAVCEKEEISNDIFSVLRN